MLLLTHCAGNRDNLAIVQRAAGMELLKNLFVVVQKHIGSDENLVKGGG